MKKLSRLILPTDPNAASVGLDYTKGQCKTCGQFYGGSTEVTKLNALYIADLLDELVFAFLYNKIIYVKMSPPYNADSADGYIDTDVSFSDLSPA